MDYVVALLQTTFYIWTSSFTNNLLYMDYVVALLQTTYTDYVVALL
jgi:hypothetical protein